jgi:Fic family protein
LLITLLLCARGALRDPLLYLSLYFKMHRSVYYDLLQRVRTQGVWEEWLTFFLEGAESTAKQAADTAVQLIRLFEGDRKRIQEIGCSALSALRVHEYLQKKPLINIGLAARALNLSVPTVSGALAQAGGDGNCSRNDGPGARPDLRVYRVLEHRLCLRLCQPNRPRYSPEMTPAFAAAGRR